MYAPQSSGSMEYELKGERGMHGVGDFVMSLGD